MMKPNAILDKGVELFRCDLEKLQASLGKAMKLYKICRKNL